MKGFYIGIFSLFILGIAFSFFLVRSLEDVGLIFLKGRKFAEAEEIFEEQYALGDRTVGTLLPLHSVQIAKGDVRRAIVLMEEYIKNDPNDVEALQLLATLYNHAHRNDDYLKVLEKLYQLRPSSVYLREIYESSLLGGNEERSKQSLTTLVNKGEASEEEYFYLATLLSSEGAFDEALDILNKRLEKFPDPLALEPTILLLSLALDQGQDEMALKEGNRLIVNSKDPKYASEVLQLFLDKGREDLALQVVPTASSLFDKDEKLYAMALNIKWSQGQRQEVFDALLAAYGAKKIQGPLGELFVSALIEEESHLLLRDFLQNYSPHKLKTKTVLGVIASAARHDKKYLVSLLKEQFKGNAPLPVNLAFEMALEGQTTLPSQIHLTTEERIELATIFAELDKKQEALALVQPLKEETLSLAQVLALAKLFVQLTAVQEGLAFFGEAHKEGALLMHVALGEKTPLEEYLKTTPKPPKSLLLELYFIAEQKEEGSAALQVATKAYELYPSLETKRYLALGYLLDNKPKKALPLLRELTKTSDEKYLKYGFLKALSQISKSDEEAKKELTAHTYEKLQPGRASSKELNELGYLLLEEAQDYALAEEVFFALAQGKKPTHPDFQTLQYLWGPRLKKESLAFLLEKIKNSSQKEQAAWAKILVQKGESQKVLELFQDKRLSHLPINMQVVLLEAHAALKNKKNLKEGLKIALSYVKEEKTLKRLLELAEEGGFLELQREALVKLIALDGSQREYWEGLSSVASSQNDICTAEMALCTLFYLLKPDECPSAKTLYHFALILEKRRCFKQAYATLQQALAKSCREEASLENQETKATILLKLRKYSAACSVFHTLYKNHPKDVFVRAAYINLLMDTSSFRRASCILREP